MVICEYDMSRSSKYYYEYKNSYGIDWGIKGFGKMKITELGDMPPPGDLQQGVLDMENEAIVLYPPQDGSRTNQGFFICVDVEVIDISYSRCI